MSDIVRTETLSRFGPKDAERVAADYEGGRTCAACKRPFKVGDFTTLIVLGPGNDKEERRRCRAGRPYTAVALEVHWVCATGQED